METPAVMFDLDGTLLDTLADIAHAANHVLTSHGFPSRPVDAYRSYIGDGVSMLFSRALPTNAGTPERLAQCGDQFREAYSRQWSVHTRAYEGVHELLASLAAREVRSAVFSNKPHEFTESCVDEFLSEFRFEVVLGQRDPTPRKPDPSGALEIAGRMSLPPNQFVFLGDTGVDMQTAVSAGMYPVGALWGFRSKEELIENGAKELVKHPLDFLDVIDGQTP